MSVKTWAPATAANLAVGFDILGISLSQIGDAIEIKKSNTKEIFISSIEGVVTNLPSDVKNNSATAGLLQLQKDLDLPFGFEIKIKKGIPLGSGMGGSAASAVGAILGANQLLGGALSKEKMLEYAVLGEAVASGGAHYDNVAPCLYGGLVLIVGKTVVELPVPKGLTCVLMHPHIQVETKEARKILKKEISLNDFTLQSAHLAGFISSCYQSDWQRMKLCLKDFIIEPQRKKLIPGFEDIQSAALQHGALGCSISGSGPSIFAFATSENEGRRIESAMKKAAAASSGAGTAMSAAAAADTWVMILPATGACVLTEASDEVL